MISAPANKYQNDIRTMTNAADSSSSNWWEPLESATRRGHSEDVRQNITLKAHSHRPTAR